MSATIFTIKRSEIEGRLDPFFYRPDFMQLENAIKKAGALPLRNYVRGIASGATPKTDEYEKYYSDKQNGIPFLRVQNLSPTGILNYEDCKYINKNTHENMLCRSQVNEGDLLVKITGVGRMAIASVAPKDFVGNTNQHMCVIKTDDEKTSWILAAWLNTDIAEKLASRRATGGTRPALDYPALLSIPVIFDERIYETMKNAVSKMKIKQQQAKQLLDSIDSYLLSELGITLPQKDNSLSKRIFTTKFSEVSGGRLDAVFNSEYFKEAENFFQTKYELYQLKLLANVIFQGCGQDFSVEHSKKLLKVKNIQTGNIIDYDDIENIREIPKSKVLMNGDIISPFIGEAIRQIKFSVFYAPIGNYEWTVDNNTGIIRINEEIADSYFVAEVLNSSIGELQIEKLISGGGVPFIGANNAKKFLIPLPPLPKQKEIASHIKEVRKQAKQLQVEADRILQDAKYQVEKMILGE